MDTLLQDLRYALRRLAKSPGFTVVAVLTLALGIGANSAIFSVVNGVLLRPLPYAEPDRLVRLFNVRDGNRMPVAPANFLDFREQGQLFSGVAAYQNRNDFTLTGLGDPVRLAGAQVSGELFEVLGVRPVLGRAFRPEENEPGQGDVVLLGYGAWQQNFGGDPRIVGSTVSIDGVTRTVVGVMPSGFAFPSSNSLLWTPLTYDDGFRNPEARGAHYLSVVARLQPGVTEERAATEMRALGDRIAQEFPLQGRNSTASSVGMREVLVGDIRPALLVLLGAVGLVLLIACANVANLLLARAAAREGELAVRTALGAGRRRLVRQLLTESVVLGLTGGAFGLLLAYWGTDLLIALQPGNIPRLQEVGVDGSVVLFTLGVALLTGFLFGLVPAVQVTRKELIGAIRESGRGSLTGRRGTRIRGGLVVAQTALAVVLLAGSGLLIRSFVGLQQVDPGFRSENVLGVNIALPPSSYPEEPQREQFFARLLERVEALPGVRTAGAVSHLPLTGRMTALGFFRDGQEPPPPGEMPIAQMRFATEDYFRAMGIPLLSGRTFTPQDGADAPYALVLSETAVRRHFPDEDPVGLRLSLTYPRGPNPGDYLTGEVVGIVGSVRNIGLDEEAEPEIYVSYRQVPVGSMDLAVRGDVPALSLAAGIREAIGEIDPSLAVGEFRTVEQIVSESVAQPRFYMLLLTIFAFVALVLASIGIFGVISYAVAQRTREIGIRIALGAAPGTVLRLVVGGALALTGLGLGLGLLGALAGNRLLAGLLFGVTPGDPLTLAAVVTILFAVALVASYLPARRAVRVDPMNALRE